MDRALELMDPALFAAGVGHAAAEERRQHELPALVGPWRPGERAIPLPHTCAVPSHTPRKRVGCASAS
eukprot:871161-Rhodomonas_salina.3